MPYTNTYTEPEPERSRIDALTEATVLEFGAPWCGWTVRAQSPLSAAMAAHPRVAHVKIHDGRGKPLGRSFGVKLWPTLVFLRDGREQARLVRPQGEADIARALALIDPPR